MRRLAGREQVVRRGGVAAKPVALATLCLLAAGMLATSVWWTLRPEGEVIDRTAFEGHGGSALLVVKSSVVVPNLEPRSSGKELPLDLLLAMRGRPLSRLQEEMPAKPQLQDLGGGMVAVVWASAYPLTALEPGQWPVAHVCAVVRAPGGTPSPEAPIEQVAVIGSLGRIIAANPEPSLRSPGQPKTMNMLPGGAP